MSLLETPDHFPINRKMSTEHALLLAAVAALRSHSFGEREQVADEIDAYLHPPLTTSPLVDQIKAAEGEPV